MGKEDGKPKRKNKPRLVVDTTYASTDHIEIDNRELVVPIKGNDITRIRAGILCADTERIFEMILYRLFCYTPHRNRIFKLWSVNNLVYFPECNASISTEVFVKFLMESPFNPVLEEGPKYLLFHPFGLRPETKRFMLYMEGFDAIVTQAFSSLLSQAEGSKQQDPVTAVSFLQYDRVLPGPEKVWNTLRTFVCASFIGRGICTAPPKLRVRVASQYAECADICGHPELAHVIQSFEEKHPVEFENRFLQELFH